jgi:hypothetical protein
MISKIAKVSSGDRKIRQRDERTGARQYSQEWRRNLFAKIVIKKT